jgi:hypothetical protein
LQRGVFEAQARRSFDVGILAALRQRPVVL